MGQANLRLDPNRFDHSTQESADSRRFLKPFRWSAEGFILYNLWSECLPLMERGRALYLRQIPCAELGKISKIRQTVCCFWKASRSSRQVFASAESDNIFIWRRLRFVVCSLVLSCMSVDPDTMGKETIIENPSHCTVAMVVEFRTNGIRDANF
ncbi:hypothetical protein BJY04DRAFT_122156 [Aspergillus karnatakaensis]|uniref:uncharacterized protein n=1 Tax=Aspergillus karnatakaensis TaxID=1810916 RepID=UPI003CCCC345